MGCATCSCRFDSQAPTYFCPYYSLSPNPVHQKSALNTVSPLSVNGHTYQPASLPKDGEVFNSPAFPSTPANPAHADNWSGHRVHSLEPSPPFIHNRGTVLCFVHLHVKLDGRLRCAYLKAKVFKLPPIK